MQPRIYWILISTAVILAGCNAATEKDQKEKEITAEDSTHISEDDLYLEDQQDPLEGSGRSGNEDHDDLESSGSGLGPDDEDGDDGSDGDNRIESTPNKPPEPKAPYSVDEPSVKTKEQNVETGNQPDDEGGIDESDDGDDHLKHDDIHGVYMNPKHEDRASSFFAQPGVLAAVIGGAVVGLLCAILVVMFIVYRMRKKDEGSYALDEPRRSPAAQAFPKPGAPHHNREFYA
ncbi:syndecan [Osmia bicornis bicornis]|uniref:syndecan n=1 Tax=Osmia bicornis bicornis TaxID=1437191 RepID=UPI0010FA433D|nr:syndecan [Osmia bicornis bicornis]